MKWLVDVDSLVSDGVLSDGQARRLREHSRANMTTLSIDLLLFAGMAAVVGGTCYWLNDSGRIAVFGAILLVLGLVALLLSDARFGLVTNAGTVIGGAMFLIGAAVRLRAWDDGSFAVALLGVMVAAIGGALWWKGPNRTRFAAGCMLIGGLATHLYGLFWTPAAEALPWVFMIYAALGLGVCGVVLDVRLVTALAVIPLTFVLSARLFYEHSYYAVVFPEPTLTIVVLGSLAVLLVILARRGSERLGRHASMLGLMCFLAVNMAFWIGSLWGDVIGLTLWGPQWETVTAGLPDDQTYGAWRTAVDAFEASAIVVPADVFSLLWVLVLAATIVWAARSGQRLMFNMAVTFGGIHFYTQYFERLEVTPGSIAIAGLIAIAVAWALWRFNRRDAPGAAS